MKKLNLNIDDAILSVGVLAFLILFAIIYGLITGDWKNAKEISSILINLIVAIGTVGAVVVALANREKDQLNKEAELLRDRMKKDFNKFNHMINELYAARQANIGPDEEFNGDEVVDLFIELIESPSTFFQFYNDVSELRNIYELLNDVIKDALDLKCKYGDTITSESFAKNMTGYCKVIRDKDKESFYFNMTHNNRWHNTRFVDKDVYDLKKFADNSYESILKILEK